MTGAELLDALEITRTGEKKLEVGRLVLRDRRDMSAEELLACMAETQENMRSVWPEGTIRKARQILGGAKPEDMLGKPPPQSLDSKEDRLIKTIVGQLPAIVQALDERRAEKQILTAEKGIGLPRKPSESGRIDKDR